MGLCDLFFPVLFIVEFFIKISYSDSYPSFKACSPSACNNSTIKYPFESWSNGDTDACNDIAYIDCPNNHNTLLHYIDLAGFNREYKYRVLGGITQSSYSTQTIRIALVTPLDYCSTTPPSQAQLNYYSNFYLSDKYTWGTMVTCQTELPYWTKHAKPVPCLECRSKNDTCFFLPSSSSVSDAICSKYSVVIPADNNYNISDEKSLLQPMQTGFEIKWNINNECHSCEASGGRCYTPFSTSKLAACICADGPRKYSCLDGKSLNKLLKTPRYIAAIGVGLSIIITTTSIIITIKINEKKRKQREEERDIRGYMDPLDSRRASIENFLQGGIPVRYSYRQIKRYTNNFVERLGQGGFGTVFKGQLPNGCMVAIKILGKSEHSQNQFMNEVATIGSIHHLHLVKLLGYCFEGCKRALIYEYMINGSLEKYIHGNNPNVLNWKQLYSIAIGTARGIAYLHDECTSRILHCDIKPHNVLLDASFSAKVADFGLAKLIDREESHVSLTGARGMPGYVAPEVWSRNYGPVSDKSDVYSYGMLVMEMVGGRKNFDMQTARSSKFYFPEWAFKQVEMGDFGRLREGNIANEDENIAKKLSLLGLWCIQYNASERPSMKRVIQMLEGSVVIAIPPQPFPVDALLQTTPSTESSSSMF